jgi:hypothetical protein
MGRSRKILPVISDRPPPVFLTPTFAAAISDSSGNFSHVIDCEVAEAEQNYKPQPRPEIGGQKITRVGALPLGQPKFLKISNEPIMSFSRVSIYSGCIPVGKKPWYIFLLNCSISSLAKKYLSKFLLRYCQDILRLWEDIFKNLRTHPRVWQKRQQELSDVGHDAWCEGRC